MQVDRLDAGQAQHLRGQPERKALQLGRSAARQRVDRFSHLERVANRATQRLLHIGHVGDGLPAGTRSKRDQGPGERLRLGDGRNEGAAAGLHVQQDRVGSGRQLLAHHATGDQGHRIDSRRGVAQCVENLVGWHHVRRLAGDGNANGSDLLDEFVDRQVDSESGNRLQLVQCPAAVPECAA